MKQYSMAGRREESQERGIEKPSVAGALEATNLSDALLKTLTSKGWRFEHHDEMLELFKNIAVEEGHRNMDRLVRAVESELLNMDLRYFGGKSLPDPAAMKKLSHLQGPLILQVVHSRDIYQSSIDASFKDPQLHRRLLRLNLTDGHTEVVAVEYTPIPSVTEEIIPGMKVLLENKIVVRNGILCLSSKVVKVVGGVVQSLFDEWNMSQKYSGFSRSSQPNDGPGPPPFEKLQLEAYRSQPNDLHDSLRSGHHSVPQESVSRKLPNNIHELSTESMTNEGKVRKSDSRPKEVLEATPVQNQAAAQKLLLKLNQSNLEHRNRRGGRFRGRGREEATVFTLDEWERSKAGPSKPVGSTSAAQDTSRDEELAWQLQNQLDMEDFCAEATNDSGTADQLKMNMFNYGRSDETSGHGSEYGRGGRGRRSRGRGRARGRFF